LTSALFDIKMSGIWCFAFRATGRHAIFFSKHKTPNAKHIMGFFINSLTSTTES
jgi:hypothetical protein